MLALFSTLLCWMACRIRSHAESELELIALRHQVAVLNRQRHGRLRLCSVDRLPWVCLFRVWPRCLETMLLVKPATVVNGTIVSFSMYDRCFFATRFKDHSFRQPPALLSRDFSIIGRMAFAAEKTIVQPARGRCVVSTASRITEEQLIEANVEGDSMLQPDPDQVFPRANHNRRKPDTIPDRTFEPDWRMKRGFAFTAEDSLLISSAHSHRFKKLWCKSSWSCGLTASATSKNCSKVIPSPWKPP